ncbi:yjfP [Ketogulonicigenium robustum]|uniref:YjfP n=1 Tax=Ketogulonicigenium robustum TaxID=92947 RepID=A0A1W6NWB3_9RHOB|nr:alpha/beta hydrolase [Ketogulonicigenium robustum]ARO13512.1 yjfP [Ketogulonicigenium robustum]
MDRMIKTGVAAFAALAMTAAVAQAEMRETVVNIPSQGVNMVGTLALPDVENPPVVLMFHGFGGVRDELEIPSEGKGIFAYTAAALADAGFASLRIDFVKSGDSDGDFADTTLEGQVGDALTAYAWLKDNDTVSDAIYLIGWSQGGFVAATTAGRLAAQGDAPQAVALWAAVAEPEPTFRALLGPDLFDAGLAAGDEPVVATMPWGNQIALKRPFFESVVAAKPLQEILPYTGPLLVAHGTTDVIVPYDAQQKYIDAHQGDEIAFTREMDHGFDIYNDTSDLDDMIAATIDWFK